VNWNQKRKEVRPQNVNADHDGLSLRLYDRGEPHRHRRGVKIEENYLIPKITKSFFFGFCCHVVCPRTSHLHVDATRFNRLWRQMSVNIWEKTHFYEKEEEEEEEYYMSFFGCSFSIFFSSGWSLYINGTATIWPCVRFIQDLVRHFMYVRTAAVATSQSVKTVAQRDSVRASERRRIRGWTAANNGHTHTHKWNKRERENQQDRTRYFHS
jgi:hypothetical protein